MKSKILAAILFFQTTLAFAGGGHGSETPWPDLPGEKEAGGNDTREYGPPGISEEFGVPGVDFVLLSLGHSLEVCSIKLGSCLIRHSEIEKIKIKLNKKSPNIFGRYEISQPSDLGDILIRIEAVKARSGRFHFSIKMFALGRKVAVVRITADDYYLFTKSSLGAEVLRAEDLVIYSEVMIRP